MQQDNRPNDIDASAFRRALESALPGDVAFDRVARSMHATDASVYQILPAAVVTPRSADDVRSVLRICAQHHVSITARGGGTSQAGRSAPVLHSTSLAI